MEILLHALPKEMGMIMGGAIGAFVVANSTTILKQAGAGMGRTLKGEKWKKEDYSDLLCLMFLLIKTIRSKGVVAIEPHIENPHESAIFNLFPKISGDHHVVEFICDYLRMMTMNFEDPNQMADAMEADIEKHHQEEHNAQHALQSMADGLPAIGIVAAVLGVIKTMGSIDQPVEVLGGMIGGALVGTFLGVLLAYCVVGPMAARLNQIIEADGKFYQLIKLIIVNHLQGLAPQVAIEIGRRNTPSLFAPSFQEFEAKLNELPTNLA
jgi:chemotaxis protein MotA